MSSVCVYCLALSQKNWKFGKIDLIKPFIGNK